MNKEEIKKVLAKYQLPQNEYFLVAGAALAMFGLRDTVDIDICVTPELFDMLGVSGNFTRTEKFGRRFLENKVCEISDRVEEGSYKPNTETLLGRAVVVDGIPCMAPFDIIEFKNAMNRPKDVADIKLLRQYIECD